MTLTQQDQIEISQEINRMFRERNATIDRYIEFQRGQLIPLQHLVDELEKLSSSSQISTSFSFSGTLSSQSTSLSRTVNGMRDKEGSVKKAGGFLTTLSKVLKALSSASAVAAVASLSTVIKTIMTLFKVMKFSVSTLVEFGKGLVTIATAIMGVISALYTKLIDMAHELMSGGSNEWAEAIRETKMHFGDLSQNAPNAAISMAKDMSAIPEAGLSVYRIFGSKGELLKEFMNDYVKKMEATFEIFAQEFADSRGALLGIAKGMGYSGEEVNTLAITAITKGHSLSKEMIDMNNAVWNVAKPFGISTKLISRDAAKAEKNVKNFGAATKESLVNAVTSARILGVDFEKLDGLMDTFSTIESSTEAGIKLFQAFEVEIDPYTLLRSQETGTILDHLRDQFKKKGVNASKFNRANIGLLASITGLSAETARQALSLNNAGKTIDEIQSKQNDGPNQVKTLSTALKELADSIEFKVFSGSMPSGGFLDMWLEGLYSQLFRNKHFRGLLRDIGKSLKIFYYEGTRFFNGFMEAFPGIKRVVQSLRTFFNPKLFKSLIGKIYGSFNKLFIGAKTGTYGFSHFMSDIGKAFKDHFEKFEEIDGGWLFQSLHEAALSTVNIYGRVFAKIGEFLSVGIRFVAASIKGDRTTLKVLKKSWKGFKKEFGGMFDPVVESIGGLVQNLSGAVSELEGAYNFQMKRNDLESYTTDAIYDKSKTFFEKVTGFFSFSTNKVETFFTDLKNSFSFYTKAFNEHVIPALLAFAKWARWYGAIIATMLIGDKILSRFFPTVSQWLSNKMSSLSAKAFGKAKIEMSNVKNRILRRPGGNINASEFTLKSSRSGFRSFFDSIKDFRYKNYPKLRPHEAFLEKILGKGGLENLVGLKGGVSESKILIQSAEDVTKLKSILPDIIESLNKFKSTTNLTQAAQIDDAIKSLTDIATGAAPISSLTPKTASIVDDAARAGRSRLARFGSGMARAGKWARAGTIVGSVIALTLPAISDKFKDLLSPRTAGVLITGLSTLALTSFVSIGVKGFIAARAAGTTFFAGLKIVGGAILWKVTVLSEFVRWGAEAVGAEGLRDVADILSITGMAKAGKEGAEMIYLSSDEYAQKQFKEAQAEFDKEKQEVLHDPIGEISFIKENNINGFVQDYIQKTKDNPSMFSSFFRTKRGEGGQLQFVPWSEIFKDHVSYMVDEYMPLSRWSMEQRTELRKEVEKLINEAQDRTWYTYGRNTVHKITGYTHLKDSQGRFYNAWSPASEKILYNEKMIQLAENVNKEYDKNSLENLRSEEFSRLLGAFDKGSEKVFDLLDKYKNYSYKDEIIKMATNAFSIISAMSAVPYVQFVKSVSQSIGQTGISSEEFHNKFYNFKKINETLYEIVQGDLAEKWDVEDTYEAYWAHLGKSKLYFTNENKELSLPNSQIFNIENILLNNLRSTLLILSRAMEIIYPKMSEFVKAYIAFEPTGPFFNDAVVKFIKEYAIVVSALDKIQSFVPKTEEIEKIEGYSVQPEKPEIDYTPDGKPNEPQMSFNLYQEFFIRLSPFREGIVKIGSNSILKNMADKMKVFKPFLSNVIEPTLSILKNISDSVDELIGEDKAVSSDNHYHKNSYIPPGKTSSGIKSPHRVEPFQSFSPFFQSVSTKILGIKTEIERLKGKSAEPYFKEVNSKFSNKKLIGSITNSSRIIRLFSEFSVLTKGPFFDPTVIFDPIISISENQNKIEETIDSFSSALDEKVDQIVVDLKTHFGKVCKFFQSTIESIFKEHNSMIEKVLNPEKRLNGSDIELSKEETDLLFIKNAPITRDFIYSFNGDILSTEASADYPFQINVKYVINLDQKLNDFIDVVFWGKESAFKDRLEMITEKRQWRDEYYIRRLTGDAYKNLTPLKLYSKIATSAPHASGAPASAPVGGKK